MASIFAILFFIFGRQCYSRRIINILTLQLFRLACKLANFQEPFQRIRSSFTDSFGIVIRIFLANDSYIKFFSASAIFSIVNIVLFHHHYGPVALIQVLSMLKRRNEIPPKRIHCTVFFKLTYFQ